MNFAETEIKKALNQFGLSDLEAKFFKFLRDNKPDVKERQIRLSNDLKLFGGQYDSDMLKAFYNHFAEPNLSHTKLKFEMEKTWHLGMRLKKWSRNNFNKQNKTNNEKQSVESFWRK